MKNKELREKEKKEAILLKTLTDLFGGLVVIPSKPAIPIEMKNENYNVLCTTKRLNNKCPILGQDDYSSAMCKTCPLANALVAGKV